MKRLRHGFFRTWLFIGAAAALLGCGASRQTAYETHLKSAQRLADRGDLTAAKEQFDRAARADSASLDEWAPLAARVMQDAVEKRIDREVASSILKTLAHLPNKPDRAVAEASRVIERQPGYAPAYTLRGIAFYKKQQYHHALADLDRAIQLDSTLALAYVNRGNTLDDSGVPLERAIADFTKAIELDSTSALAYFNRAIAHSRQRVWASAIADLTRVIALRPAGKDAYRFRAVASYRLKQCLDSAVRADAERADALGEPGARRFLRDTRPC